MRPRRIPGSAAFTTLYGSFAAGVELVLDEARDLVPGALVGAVDRGLDDAAAGIARAGLDGHRGGQAGQAAGGQPHLVVVQRRRAGVGGCQVGGQLHGADLVVVDTHLVDGAVGRVGGAVGRRGGAAVVADEEGADAVVQAACGGAARGARLQSVDVGACGSGARRRPTATDRRRRAAARGERTGGDKGGRRLGSASKPTGRLGLTATARGRRRRLPAAREAAAAVEGDGARLEAAARH